MEYNRAMKVVVLIATIMLGAVTTFSQEIAVTREVSDVSRPQPSMTLEQASRIAKKFVAKNKIDISGRQLTHGSFMMFGSSKETLQPAWQFFWTTGKLFSCDGVEIIVFDKTRTAMQKASP